MYVNPALVAVVSASDPGEKYASILGINGVSVYSDMSVEAILAAFS